jgi:hypothetical protein
MTMLYPIVLETEDSGAVSAYVPGLPVYVAAETDAKAERAIRGVLTEYLNAHPASRPDARVRVARFSDAGKGRVDIVGVAALVGALGLPAPPGNRAPSLAEPKGTLAQRGLRFLRGAVKAKPRVLLERPLGLSDKPACGVTRRRFVVRAPEPPQGPRVISLRGYHDHLTPVVHTRNRPWRRCCPGHVP